MGVYRLCVGVVVVCCILIVQNAKLDDVLCSGHSIIEIFICYCQIESAIELICLCGRGRARQIVKDHKLLVMSTFNQKVRRVYHISVSME